MTIDPNTARMIEEAIAPILEEIKVLKKEIKELKEREPKIIYLDKKTMYKL